MTGSILIVGATGNTGQNVVRTLSAALATSAPVTKLIALTRDANSAAARTLGQLPGVTFEVKNWVSIDAAWLRERDVKRVFLIPYNGAAQFTDETNFLLAARDAGVEYLVRLSTMVHYIQPDSPVFYGRQHWATEALLDTPAFASLGWTSLQPNFFGSVFLADCVPFIKEFRRTGKQPGALKIHLDEHNPVAMIDPAEVGAFAATLLLLDPAARQAHLGQRYVMAGPEDVNGQDAVRVVEAMIGEKVGEVEYRDFSYQAATFDEGLLASARLLLNRLWDGSASRKGAPNTKAVEGLGAPKATIRDNLERLVNE